MKIAVTTTGIPVNNNVIFGMGIFHTANGLKSPATGQNQCAPDVPREQFWPRHYQNFVRQWRKNAASAKHWHVYTPSLQIASDTQGQNEQLQRLLQSFNSLTWKINLQEEVTSTKTASKVSCVYLHM